jgi:hypothetical protein
VVQVGGMRVTARRKGGAGARRRRVAGKNDGVG